MIVHNSPSSTIHLLKGMSLLYTEWNETSSEMSEEEVKDEFRVIVQKVEELKPEFMIADTLKFKYAMNSEMQRWLTRFIIADIIEMGVKKYAMIVNEKLYQEYTAKEEEEELVEGFSLRYFPNKDQAMNWLLIA